MAVASPKVTSDDPSSQRQRPTFYFDQFEDRVPEAPIPHSVLRETLWQYLALINIALGAWYIHWRWTASLNPDALWFAIPLVLAETCAFIGLCLFTFNLWKTEDFEQQEPPSRLSEIGVEVAGALDRDVRVDVFYPSYDEDPELVRLSIEHGKQMTVPDGVEVSIFVLDDGKRAEMKAVTEQEGVGYITRENNIGFKAGNMRNAMEQTSGDIILICDADTRVFPTMLEDTLGYFRDPDVAWVQTPQWFFDIPAGERLPEVWGRNLGVVGRLTASGLEKVFGPIVWGNDPFSIDPKMFYDVILRRRNRAAGSFCCGAGSLHRRDAVMRVALRAYSEQVSKEAQTVAAQLEGDDAELEDMMLQQIALETEMTPYKFHVSEDIYTSIILHSDPDRHWKSVLHPKVESKMLSPQDLQTWVVQRFKYAGGTLDIALNDNPVFRPSMSLPRRIFYAMTVWSYLGAVWTAFFLFAPIIYFFTGAAPVAAYSFDFFKHIIPFLISNELAFMVGTWGVSGYRGKVTYLATFSLVLRALSTVLKGEKIKFPATPKDRQEGNFLKLAIPQMAIAGLTLLGIGFALTQYFAGAKGYALSGIVANGFWGLNNTFALIPFIFSAVWKPREDTL